MQDGVPVDRTPVVPSQFDADGALSREFLVARGFCCREGCRNCPYGFEAGADLPKQRERNEP
ncbi:MAG: DUF5522 domain-containing protein [Chthoniobacterales bacterium]